MFNNGGELKQRNEAKNQLNCKESLGLQTLNLTYNAKLSPSTTPHDYKLSSHASNGHPTFLFILNSSLFDSQFVNSYLRLFKGTTDRTNG